MLEVGKNPRPNSLPFANHNRIGVLACLTREYRGMYAAKNYSNAPLAEFISDVIGSRRGFGHYTDSNQVRILFKVDPPKSFIKNPKLNIIRGDSSYH